MMHIRWSLGQKKENETLKVTILKEVTQEFFLTSEWEDL